MTNKFLKEAVVAIVGKSYEKLADLLDNPKHVNEFLIAKNLDITINQTRNLLYRLSDQGIVSSIRKKDKKKGWYTYFWKLENLKALEFLRGLLQKRLDQINTQAETREKNEFFVCNRCHIEFTEENALLMNFTCNECGEVFEVKDNSKVVKELKKNYEKFEKEIVELDKEIDVEKGKLEKKKEKEMKKEKIEAEKKKAEKKEAARIKREEKKAAAEKEKKKVSKEKAVKTSKKKVSTKGSSKKIAGSKKSLKKSANKK